MSEQTPRLRMFAGPNGSGKSSLKLYLPSKLLGVYLNADEIEAHLRERGDIHFTGFGTPPPRDEIRDFFLRSTLLKTAGLAQETSKLKFFDGGIEFTNIEINSYFASVWADFLRQELLKRRVSFTFETVMSHHGKVDFLREARQAGFRTYLYFVATDDPLINVSRVHNRVRLGGHSVPESKIIDRYHRSLGYLAEAILLTDRAYIFDNSAENTSGHQTWLAEITDGKNIEFRATPIPAWFKRAVLDKMV